MRPWPRPSGPGPSNRMCSGAPWRVRGLKSGSLSRRSSIKSGRGGSLLSVALWRGRRACWRGLIAGGRSTSGRFGISSWRPESGARGPSLEPDDSLCPRWSGFGARRRSPSALVSIGVAASCSVPFVVGKLPESFASSAAPTGRASVILASSISPSSTSTLLNASCFESPAELIDRRN